MLKVLVLTTNLRVSNGVTSFLMNYAQSLSRTQIKMDFALYQAAPSPHLERLEQAGSKVFLLPPVKHMNAHVKACRQILTDGHYDIIHDNTLHISLPMMLCAWQLHVPVRLLHSHSSRLGETMMKELRNKAFLHLLRGLMTHYAACSQAAGLMMFGKRKFTILPNVIDPAQVRFDAVKRCEMRKSMGVENKRVVISVGRTSAEKNPYFAIDAVIAAHRRDENLVYWWVGSGPLDCQMADYIAEKHAESYIRLLGSRYDVIDLYQAADAFFLPSLFEGLPLTGVEAQAMGLPSVISDAVTKELVYTDLICFLSLTESIERWADALLKAFKTMPDRGSYNEALLRSPYAGTNAGDRLLRYYKDLCESGR